MNFLIWTEHLSPESVSSGSDLGANKRSTTALPPKTKSYTGSRDPQKPNLTSLIEPPKTRYATFCGGTFRWMGQRWELLHLSWKPSQAQFEKLPKILTTKTSFFAHHTSIFRLFFVYFSSFFSYLSLIFFPYYLPSWKASQMDLEITWGWNKELHTTLGWIPGEGGCGEAVPLKNAVATASR